MDDGSVRKNSGKGSEAIFVKSVEESGGYVHRLRDASDLSGLNKRRVAAFPVPADFLVVRREGYYELAEVKSTLHATGFPFNNLRPAQRVAAKVASIMGAPYNFYIHQLERDEWYLMPAKQFVAHKEKSIKFAELARIT